LLRPGLEALRDLAAADHAEAVLIYSPDRFSRKYVYQVLLAEGLSRCGVELVFLKAPSGTAPEDQLLVQFQGMIAEYERAQIAERSRRGKRHRAQQGSINVLSGAPYAYRYVRKSDTTAERGVYSDPDRADTLGAIYGARACCATQHTGAGRALGRPSSVRGSASRDGCGNARGWLAATVPTANRPDRIGSRSWFRL